MEAGKKGKKSKSKTKKDSSIVSIKELDKQVEKAKKQREGLTTAQQKIDDALQTLVDLKALSFEQAQKIINSYLSKGSKVTIEEENKGGNIEEIVDKFTTPPLQSPQGNYKEPKIGKGKGKKTKSKSKSTNKKPSEWMEFVNEYKKMNGGKKYKEVLQEAKPLYDKAKEMKASGLLDNLRDYLWKFAKQGIKTVGRRLMKGPRSV